MKLVVALALLVPISAHAEVSAELSAGAGTDTSDPTGFATAHADLSAELSRPAPPILQRGLFDHTTEPGAEPGGLWLFTGLDADDRDGIGATGDATLYNDSLLLSSRAWGRLAGWGVTFHADVQPTGDLRDRFWRSGRGVTDAGFAIDIPPMWAIGTANVQLLAGLETVALGTRSSPEGPAASDEELGITGFRLQTPRTVVDVFVLDVFQLGVARATIGEITYGTAASGLDFSLAKVTRRLTPDIAMTVHGGLDLRSPIGPWEHTSGSDSFDGPSAATGSYGLDISGHDFSLGGGSWIRLDPTGHAVDAGQLATASLDREFQLLHLRGGLEVGRLRRAVLGEYAPAGLMPVGTRMVMARATLEAQLRLTSQLALIASSWVERSDRDDPRWSVPGNGTLETHAGAELTALWRLGHHRG